MLAVINPVALPALRVAGTFFLIINLLEWCMSFAIATGSSIKIQMYRKTLRPPVN
jgi:hypothetical protein